ncbi:hypothetical protein BN10_300095 [Phycicoccus elongatus Lp2]|uniref:Uncharacterized protein n=1 Tax=Phycicoccus elongatus Lp2 TaxID=1193181 RepID=N0E485_9MICO|nr:hypothetical protein BN10_300095 [Phycicoccus elongatus Lp2]
MRVGVTSDNGGVTDQPAQPPYRGQIRQVIGRQAKGGKRTGLPKIHELDLEHAGGKLISARGHQPPAGDGARTATGVCAIERGQFPYCPICLREDVPADTMEHVPPTAFGGTVMANTCADCNNRLGSRTEAALQDWYDDAIRAHFTSDASPEPFGHDRILLLKTDSDEVVHPRGEVLPRGRVAVRPPQGPERRDSLHDPSPCRIHDRPTQERLPRCMSALRRRRALS